MRRTVLILIWLLVTLSLSGYLTARFVSEDRSVFLPGVTTHGHYQIELRCDVCHTPDMGVKHDSCVTCHGEELRLADDSHPRAKFLDPRQADRVAKLDVTQCITCHVEHRAPQTTKMGVTLPRDYCAHCHSDIEKERPSHQGMSLMSCATAGCHNYHDNRALHEDFLAAHLNDGEHLESQVLPSRTLSQMLGLALGRPVAETKPDAPPSVISSSDLHQDWLTTAHAKAGVNCSACHERAATTASTEHGDPPSSVASTWTDHPPHTLCATCHDQEAAGFLAGRHGMRLAQQLSAMTPGQARQPMKAASLHEQLTCTSCHQAHRFDTAVAAAQACIACHDDKHSTSFAGSPHDKLWQKELRGQAPAGTGVSCATCHLPRETHRENGLNVVRVQHNQNDNLRPNDKMARNVCMNCHGLGFALDALADTALIESNFRGQPARHIQSMDMVERKLEQLERSRKSPTPTPVSPTQELSQ